MAGVSTIRDCSLLEQLEQQQNLKKETAVKNEASKARFESGTVPSEEKDKALLHS
jgi:hypothetical protein